MKTENKTINATSWKIGGRSRRERAGDGRVASFLVPERNLVAYIGVPNGGKDNECDELCDQIVREHNEHIALLAAAEAGIRLNEKIKHANQTGEMAFALIEITAVNEAEKKLFSVHEGGAK